MTYKITLSKEFSFRWNNLNILFRTSQTAANHRKAAVRRAYNNRATDIIVSWQDTCSAGVAQPCSSPPPNFNSKEDRVPTSLMKGNNADFTAGA